MIKRNSLKATFLLIGVIVYTAFTGCIDKDRRSATQPIPVSTSQKVQRFGMVTGLKAEKMEYYKKLHSAVWPGVLKKIKECNIRNYSIYLQKINGKYYLFSYFEYVGTDFNKDMQRMAADSTTQLWWKETNPTQNPLPQAAVQHKIWTNMPEIFHTK